MEDKKEFNIEDAFKRLEEINAALSNSETSLKDALDLYKEGVLLAEACRKNLEGVEQEMTILGENKE